MKIRALDDNKQAHLIFKDLQDNFIFGLSETFKHIKGNDHWQTPPDLYKKLDDEFNFDFDPCPILAKITKETDGLLIDWGKVNFVNPPYNRKLKEAFVIRAIEFAKLGRTCVMLLPVSTSTKLFHEYIQPNASEIRFIRGRVKFIGIGSNKVKGRKSITGMHDSMIVVFKDLK